MRLEGHEQEACVEHAVNRTDAGGLEDYANAGGFSGRRGRPPFASGREEGFWRKGTTVSLISITAATAIPTMPRIAPFEFR